MFDNIGSKIKTLAIVCAWIGIIGSFIGGIYVMAELDVGIGFLIMIAGSLVSWIGSFFMYGLGQLIENSDILVQQNRRLLNNSLAPSTPFAKSVCRPEPEKKPEPIKYEENFPEI